MQADWTVECGADDPTVDIPWANATESARYYDLRLSPTALEKIPEAQLYPCIANVLQRWNQLHAPIFTVKCDAWSYAADLFDSEDLPGFAYAQASYIDLIPINLHLYSNFSACERQLRIWTENANSIAIPESRCEWTLRPARIFSQTAEGLRSSVNRFSDNGFATTLYVWGYGASPHAAEAVWCSALEALIEPVLLLGRP